MRLTLFLFMAIVLFWAGKPAEDAKVIIQDVSGNRLFGFQRVGAKGMSGFKYMNEGTYRLVMVFPQQTGKWIKEKPKHRTLTKAGYNEKKKTYYYQGEEGFFAVKFKSLRKIDKDSFHPVFKELKGETDGKVVIAEFIVKKNGGKLMLKVDKLTASQFKKATDKIETDISTLSIQGIK